MDIDRILALSFDGLEDASGDIEGLPLRIAGLLADEEDARREAIHALRYRLFHQGTLATATPRVVPVLIQIALGPATRDRHLTLTLLRWLLTCLPENREDGFGNASGPPATELGLATADAVRAGLGGYLSLFGDSDARARGAAAALAAFAASGGTVAASVAMTIGAALAEHTNALTLTNQLCAFGLAARRAEIASAETPVRHLESEETIVRVGAAVAVLGYHQGERWLREAARVSAVSASAAIHEPDQLLWASGDPGLLAAEALAFAARRERPKKSGAAWSPMEVEAIESLKAIISARLPYRDVEASRVTAADVMMAQFGDGPVPVEHEPPADELQKAYSLLALSQHMLEIGFSDLRDGGAVRDTPAGRRDLRAEQLELVRFCVDADLAAYYTRVGLPESTIELAKLFHD